MFPSPLEHRVEHRFGEPFRKRVLLTGMETADDASTVGQFELGTVGKFRQTAFVPASIASQIDDRAPADLPQSDDHFHGQRIKRPVEPLAAIREFLVRRLVVRRSTVAGRRDGTVLKSESVITRSRRGLAGESSFVQSPKQPVAAAIARKHPPGPIRTVSRWCKADDQ